MHNNLPLQFSLRGHKAPLAALCTFTNSSLDYALASADRDGWIIIWSLISRRPLAVWKAHDGQILTLKDTPAGLLSHGRDSTIRIWRVDAADLANCSSDLSGTNEDLPRPPVFEIPVNSLNFCNVDYCEGLLITPATVDANNFDIYRISGTSLTRLIENKSVAKEDPLEVNSPLKRDGCGIAMRVLFISTSLFFVGYESGAVFGFTLDTQAVSDRSTPSDRTILNKDAKCHEVYSLVAHTPLPVLSMTFDPLTGQLFTGSASKKLMIHDVSSLTAESPLTTHNLRHYGIQSIQLAGDSIIIGFWDGVVKVFSRNFEELGRLERQVEMLVPEEDDIAKPTKKSLSLVYWSPKLHDPATLSRKQKLEYGRVADPLLFVGHGDGLISAFSLREDKKITS